MAISYDHQHAASPYYTSCIVLARVGLTLVDVSLTALSSVAWRTITAVVSESNWYAGSILCTGRPTAGCYSYDIHEVGNSKKMTSLMKWLLTWHHHFGVTNKHLISLFQ